METNMEQQTGTQGSPTPQRLSPDTKERALRDVAWVAEFLGVSKSWVYQATSNGVLPCIRLGSTLRFEKAAIERWLKGEQSKSVKLPGCR
jgi:excisionase family DNA binding protein